MAPRGVVATGTPFPSRHGHLPVRAFHQRGRDREYLHAVWRRLAPSPLCPSVDACWCAPPTIVSKSSHGFARCVGGQNPSLSWRGRLPVRASHRRGEFVNGTAVWRSLDPLRPGADACWCVPPTVAGESRNGSVRCGSGRHPPSRSSYHRHKAWAKTLPSYYLVDDDYVLSPFTSLEASLKSSCALLW
jgi:hypothetical protein